MPNSLECGPQNLPKAAVWGARTMVSSQPCNTSGTVKVLQLVLGKYPNINRSLTRDTELELQIFDAVTVPLAMQNQSFRLSGTARIHIYNFRRGPFNTMLTVSLRSQLRILKGQYVGIAVKGDPNGRLNIASRSPRIEDKKTISLYKTISDMIKDKYEN